MPFGHSTYMIREMVMPENMTTERRLNSSGDFMRKNSSQPGNQAYHMA